MTVREIKKSKIQNILNRMSLRSNKVKALVALGFVEICKDVFVYGDLVVVDFQIRGD